MSRSTIHFLCVLLVAGLGLEPTVAQSTGGDEVKLQKALAVVDSLREDGEFRQVLSRLHRLQNNYPERVEILYRLAFAWSDLGKDADRERKTVSFYRQSLSAAEAAVAADSENAWAHLAVALAEGRLTLHVSSRERVERSRAVKEHAERAIELDSTLAGAYHLRGRWHQGAAELNFFQRTAVKLVYGGLPEASFEQAVSDFQRALELETRTYHHLELGKTYLKMGRKAAAREQLQAALEVSARDPFASEYKAEARQLLQQLS